ncbi:MAG: hypothetical protein RL042_2274 [Nitrospirota bacterium]|jgi:hypothetical protein
MVAFVIQHGNTLYHTDVRHSECNGEYPGSVGSSSWNVGGAMLASFVWSGMIVSVAGAAGEGYCACAVRGRMVSIFVRQG